MNCEKRNSRAVAALPGASEQLPALRARLPLEATDAVTVALPSSALPGVTWSDAGALEPLVAAVDRLAEGSGAAVAAFANVREEPAWRPLRRALERRGCRAAMTAAEAVLDVAWGSLDEYVASLRPSRRGAVRRERRRFLGAGVATSIGGADLLSDDLVDLQHAQYLRHGHRTSKMAVEDRFRRARTLPGLTFLRGDLAGRPLGFLAFCEQPGRRRLVNRLAAFAPNPVGAYFNLAYYELLRHAIERSVAAIHYGTGSYPAKLARGCRLVPLLTYVRPLSPRAAAVTEAAALCDRLQRAWFGAIT